MDGTVFFCQFLDFSFLIKSGLSYITALIINLRNNAEHFESERSAYDDG